MTGILVIVSGPSGAGKTSIVEGSLARKKLGKRIITSTTRPMRAGEVDGRDYHFLAPDEFVRKLEAGEFAEHALVYGKYYGTLQADIIRTRNEYPAAIAIVDIQGAKTLMEKFPDAHTVFITISKDDMRERLAKRGETGDSLTQRLASFDKELETGRTFERIITNKRGKLNDAIQDFIACIVNWEEQKATKKKRVRPDDGAPQSD